LKLIYSNGVANLLIKDCTVEDFGKYEMIAKSTVGFASQTISIEIAFKRNQILVIMY